MIPELKLEGTKLTVSYELTENETYKINNKDNLFTLAIYKKPITVTGLSSMCGDGGHVFFLDYDNICWWIVEKDIERLVSSNPLSPFYVFTTKEEEIDGELVGNYHCICLQKFSASQIISMQRQTNCDKAYTTMPLRNVFRSWVLRTSGKPGRDRPVFKKIIGSDHTSSGTISSAHLKTLRSLYDLPEIQYKNEDGLDKVYRNIYETGNY